MVRELVLNRSTAVVLVVVASVVLPPSRVTAPLPPAAPQVPSSWRKLPTLVPLRTRP